MTDPFNAQADAEPAGSSTVMFFVATFVVTWGSWLGWAALKPAPSEARSTSGPWTLLLFLGIFAPALVAIALTRREQGSLGVRRLLRRLFQWRVPMRWYILALSFMAAVKLGAAFLYRAMTGAWPAFGQQPVYLLIAATIVSTIVLGQAGEEVGWRGYALPRMSTRYGLPIASILLGIIWAAWHLPLFFIPGGDLVGTSFPVYVLLVMPLSVVIAWLYERTGGSLLLTMLMHAAINNTTSIVPSGTAVVNNPFAFRISEMGALTAALLWVVAAWLLISMSRRRNARRSLVPALA